MAKYFMGIDVGTNESKGVLIDENCKIIQTAVTSHGLENPKPNYYEHDAEKVWWADVCKLSQALLKDSGVKNADVACMGVSALNACVVPVDENCVPLRKAILYGIDARAAAEQTQMENFYGPERMKQLFGDRQLCSSDCMPKILWIKNNEPEVYAKAYKFLTGSSYITAKLTGRYVVDRFLGLASFNPLYHSDGTPNEETCKPICRPDQLAEVLNTVEIAGSVTAKAAAETGLKEGTPVIVGTDDSGAEAISTGVLTTGDMMLQFGSSIYIIVCNDKLVNDDRIWREEFIIPGSFDVSAGTNTAGTMTRWLRDNVFVDKLAEEKESGVNAYSLMAEGADKIAPGCDGLVTLPYLAGERTPINDPLAKGMIFGMTLAHTRTHLYRSALEGVGFEVNQLIKIFEENKVPLNKIMAVGGGTKNPLWMQIVADITGKCIQTAKITIGASFGDAMMAAMGVKYFDSFADLGKKIKPDKTYEPNMENHEKYKHFQEIFDELYIANRDLMHRV